MTMKTFLIALISLSGLPAFSAAQADSEVAAAIALLESKGYTVTAPNATAPTASANVPTLSLREIERELDFWPVEVELLEGLQFQGGRSVNAGSLLTIESIANGQLTVRYRDLYFDVEAEITDLVARASAIAAGTSGFPGRLPTMLAGRAEVPQGGGLRKASADDLAGADVYVLYMGSPACGWCGRFYPTMLAELKKLEREHPGQVMFIHSSMRVSSSDYRGYMKTLGADAGLPPGDRFFSEALMAELNVDRISIPQPSVILMNASGKVLGHASRDGSNLRKLEALLERQLPQMLDNPSQVRPRWMTSAVLN